jgi:hypothetical protein
MRRTDAMSRQALLIAGLKFRESVTVEEELTAV